MSRDGYEHLVDPNVLRDYADDLNDAAQNATLPRGFRIAPATPTPEPAHRPRVRRSRRMLVHDNPFGGPLILDPDDESDYPEPPVPLFW